MAACYRSKDNELTRNPSDGSVPAIAPALAAVKDSTSSIEGKMKSRHCGCGRLSGRPIRTTTKVSSSSTISVILLKSL